MVLLLELFVYFQQSFILFQLFCDSMKPSIKQIKLRVNYTNTQLVHQRYFEWFSNLYSNDTHVVQII